MVAVNPTIDHEVPDSVYAQSPICAQVLAQG